MFKLRPLNQKGFTGLEIVLIVVVVGIVAGAIGYTVSNMNKKENATNSEQSSANTEENVNKTEEKAKLPDLVDYVSKSTPTGIDIKGEADIAKLHDTSDEFKDFIKAQYISYASQGDGCGETTMMGVEKVYKDSFASGGVGGCGGAKLIWKKESSGWKEVLGMQSAPACEDVNKHKIPNVLIGECYDDPEGVNLVKNLN